MFIIGDDIILTLGKGGMVFLSRADNAGGEGTADKGEDILFNIPMGLAISNDILTVLK